MTGLNKLFEKSDGKIDTKKEFKDFEDIISSSEGKQDFIQACIEDSQKIVDSFDPELLTVKIQQARGVESKSKAMKSEVRNAYLVIYKIKAGGIGTYQELLKSAEIEVALREAKHNLLDKINSNSDWNESLKLTAGNVIEDLFSECDSVEEFEMRAGTRLSTVEGMDNVGDFFRAIPNTIMEANKGLHKQALELMRKVGVSAQEINEVCKQAIENGILKMKDFIDRCKETGMAMVDIAKTVCERGQSQFANFIAALKEVGEDITDALKTAREWTGKQWNNFVEFCGGKLEDLKEFGMMLVEQGELMWNQLVEGFMNSIESTKELCKNLIEKGLVKMREFSEWCVGLGEKGKELIVSLIEWNVNLWNDFADFCTDKREAMKDIFTTVATELLQKGTIALETFAEWCKGAWETVKDAACIVLVLLIKAGKFAIEAVIGTIVVVVGLPVMAVSKLLISTGKEIYKDAVAASEFISDLSAALREKAKQFGISAVDFVKDFIDQCKAFSLMSKEYVSKVVGSLREKMKEAGMAATDFIKATYETVKGALGNAWYKTAEFFKNLGLKVEDIAVTLREVSKGAWEGCVNFVIKSYRYFNNALNVLINKCKISIDKIGNSIMTAGIKVAEFVKYVKEKALITLENISKWCNGTQEKIKLFIKTSLETAQATWEDLVTWCGGQLDKIASVLKDLYGKTKEGIKNFIKLVGKSAIETGQIILKWGIAVPDLVIGALKELGCSLQNVAELCVKYAKIGTQKLCDLLMNAYGATTEMIVHIGESVAAAVHESAKDVRDWIYTKTKDIKQAIKATKEYISHGVKDICEWMYNKGIQLKDICKTICEEFKGNLAEITKGLSDFATECAIKRNDIVSATSQWLTIDV